MQTSISDSPSQPPVIKLTRAQAQSIVDSHLPADLKSPISSLTRLKSKYGQSKQNISYQIQLTSSVRTYVVILAHPSTPHPFNTLPTLAHIHTLISMRTEIPLSTLHALDTSSSVVPYHFLLLSHQSGLISFARAKSSKRLGIHEDQIYYQLGIYLRQLHSIQNDWFGPPLQVKSEPQEPSYSWQESFTPLLENLLDVVESDKIDLPYTDLRKYLSRAMGCNLFDNVEAPSLVWVTGSEDDIFISWNPGDSAEPTIANVALTFTHAIWGDPLLESVLMLLTQGLMRAYDIESLNPLMPRQRTKRLWYSAYLALIILVEGDGKQKEWANKTLNRLAEVLKDAPCN